MRLGVWSGAASSDTSSGRAKPETHLARGGSKTTAAEPGRQANISILSLRLCVLNHSIMNYYY